MLRCSFTHIAFSKTVANVNTVKKVNNILVLLNWPKSSFRFSLKTLWKNPNEHFNQPNTDASQDLMGVWASGFSRVYRQHLENIFLNHPCICSHSVPPLLANWTCFLVFQSSVRMSSFDQKKMVASHGVGIMLLSCYFSPTPGSSLGQLWIHAERMPGGQDGHETCSS